MLQVLKMFVLSPLMYKTLTNAGKLYTEHDSEIDQSAFKCIMNKLKKKNKGTFPVIF